MLGEGEPAAGPWRVQPTREFARRLLLAAGAPAGRPAVVAVDGRSGSGKTTVSERVCAAVPRAVVVHTDDVAWHQAILDWDDLLADGVLRPLQRGEPVRFRPPAWTQWSRDGAIDVPADGELVIVEGVGAARRELMPLLDLVVWVQSDLVESKRRAIERDGGDEEAVSFWDLWMAEELPFLARQRPWERAAFIVAGTPSLPYDPVSEVVVAGPVNGG